MPPRPLTRRPRPLTTLLLQLPRLKLSARDGITVAVPAVGAVAAEVADRTGVDATDADATGADATGVRLLLLLLALREPETRLAARAMTTMPMAASEPM